MLSLNIRTFNCCRNCFVHFYNCYQIESFKFYLIRGKKMSFPDKDKRKKCWASRDAYWECLDQNNDDSACCMELKKCFENDCPNLWVQHFNRKREYLKFKEKLQTDDPLEALKKS
ncbi:cytochrome c oxidase assembly factor 6 homolog [Caerostris darwini]|uniref:Cytochrome c oxidase assembly factor 6 homolog n=1 Tax=Caerostris darwini TaxID=1538125 RepID=A0AAV4R3W4_9ARAC|nr:hypothetical protein CDAR_16191 [Caerostris darwini]GIY14996.1 cytochrome c oxidase assembly factor 6 homolog [Caerostris darwini]